MCWECSELLKLYECSRSICKLSLRENALCGMSLKRYLSYIPICDVMINNCDLIVSNLTEKYIETWFSMFRLVLLCLFILILCLYIIGIPTWNRGFQWEGWTFVLFARIGDLRLPNGPLNDVMFCVVWAFLLVTSIFAETSHKQHLIGWPNWSSKPQLLKIESFLKIDYTDVLNERNAL